MVEETFLYPDISTPHRSDENKIDERNFIRQSASMEEMEHYVFLWSWSTTGWTEELLLPF